MVAKVVLPPENLEMQDEEVLFLAGGITGAPDWQTELIKRLWELPITICNPRCPIFDEEFDDVKHDAQVRWEYEHLRRADIISFWFPKEALCMITLHELGFVLGQYYANDPTPALFIGVEPGYKKSRSVHVQTKLTVPDIKIAESLGELAIQISEYIHSVGDA